MFACIKPPVILVLLCFGGLDARLVFAKTKNLKGFLSFRLFWICLLRRRCLAFASSL